MHKIGDTVVYGMTGVCKIADIEKKDFIDNKLMDYYVLKPVHSGNSTIYAPVDSSEQRIRPMLSKDEVMDIIKKVSGETPEVRSFFDKDKCNEIMKSGDRCELMRLIRQMSASKKAVLKLGRKFHIANENILRTAQKLLCDEFSAVLEITPDEVLPMIL